jgi:hypothetical protein
MFSARSLIQFVTSIVAAIRCAADPAVTTIVTVCGPLARFNAAGGS